MTGTYYNTWYMVYTKLFTISIIYIVFPEQKTSYSLSQK